MIFMAKKVYKIPYNLDANYGDMEISFRSKDGISSKPIPIKVIISYLFSFFTCFLVITKTVIASGSFLQIACFVILWLLLTLVFFKYDSTKRMQFELLPTLLNYIPKKARVVITRRDANVTPFFRIVGISSIDKRTGLVKYFDGTYAFFYRVVGSASILLFDSDKDAVLDRVDNFYRKLNTESEVLFITTKSAQQVYRQIFSLKEKYSKLEYKDDDITRVANAQFKMLKDYVGKDFRSIHQYMVIKADNKEMLLQTKNILQSEIENSTRMIRRCIPMNYNDIIQILGSVYRANDD